MRLHGHSQKANYVKINSYIEIVGQSTTVAAGGLAAILLSGLEWGLIDIKPLAIEKILIIDSMTYLVGSFIIAKIIDYFITNLLRSFVRDTSTSKLKPVPKIFSPNRFKS